MWGGPKVFGLVKGETTFLSVGQRGDQNFFRVKEGGPKFFLKFFLVPSVQFLLKIHYSKHFRAFGATFLFTIVHAGYSLFNLITVPSIVSGGGPKFLCMQRG